MYTETSSQNPGDGVFLSFEGTDNIKITNISVYYNRFWIVTDDSLKEMGKFSIQLLSENNTCVTIYTIPRNSQFSSTPTEWSLLISEKTQSS